MTVVIAREYESGSCPWMYWNETLYIGKNRESHYDMIRRLVPDDLATITFIDDQDVVCGRVSLHLGDARNFNIYKADKVPAKVKRKIAGELGLAHGA